MPAPLYVGHKDLVGIFGFTLFYKQNTRFGVRAAFPAGLEQGLGQSDDSQNLRPASEEGDDVLVRRVAENALRQYDAKPATWLQKLDASFEEEDLWRLMLVEARGRLGDLRGLVPLPLMAEFELRQKTLPLDLYLGSKGRIGQDDVKRPQRRATRCLGLPFRFRKEAVVAEHAATAVSDNGHVRLGHFRQE